MILRPAEIPKNPGVYIFRDGKGSPIYIGKAANLKQRLYSYWRRDVSDKIRMMIGEASEVEWIEAESEVDALIKESKHIKGHYPKYNILMRDDKNYFYAGVTANDDFPKIFLTHQPGQEKRIKGKTQKIHYIGPFTSGSALKTTLRMLRNIFPFCTCKEMHKRPCLNAEIGRCPGYCCLKTTDHKKQKIYRDEYRKNIRNIIGVLSGREKNILKELKREMRQSIKDENFELAAKRRDEIIGLENVISHSSHIENDFPKTFLNWPKIQKNLKVILGIKIERAEGYDISNISGTEATGSMVVFIDGKPSKSEYRKFKIRNVSGPNDIAMHEEVMARRLTHPEWKYPELMLIDGGRAQLNGAVLAVRKLKNFKIKIAALAKREEELYIEGRNKPTKLSSLPPDVAFFFQRIRDESHRFARRYHLKRREILYRTQ